MTPYASRTGTRRNLAALRAADWRLLISRAGVWRTEGFSYGLDNGAWTDFRAGKPFDALRFEQLVAALGRGADWIVAPDIVAGGSDSLRLSLSWLAGLRQVCKLVLIAVQDGMSPHDLQGIAGPGVGIFLGGTTEWKLAQMLTWGRFAAGVDAHYHVARVNSERRIRQAAACGAHSFDGSSASRYAVTLPPLDRARRQLDMWGAT